MSDFFMIEYENMPCIYQLSFDAKTPAIIVRAHNEFIERWPKFLGEAPIVKHFKQSFGFSAFKSVRNSDFGFNSAFKRVGDGGDFAVFSVRIPVAQKVAQKVCPLCGGDKKSLFGKCARCKGKGKLEKICPDCHGAKKDESDFPCLYCGGKGKKTYINWKPLYAVSASFTLFFELASFKMDKREATTCRFPQLILINTITEQKMHGGSLDGTYSMPMVKWLASFEPNTEITEMTKAMFRAHERMFGKVDQCQKYSFWAKVAYENGWLNVSCQGDACGLHPSDSMGPTVGEGYKFSCHNVDSPMSPMQQITLLAGLAALCDKVQKEAYYP